MPGNTLAKHSSTRASSSSMTHSVRPRQHTMRQISAHATELLATDRDRAHRSAAWPFRHAQPRQELAKRLVALGLLERDRHLLLAFEQYLQRVVLDPAREGPAAQHPLLDAYYSVRARAGDDGDRPERPIAIGIRDSENEAVFPSEEALPLPRFDPHAIQI